MKRLFSALIGCFIWVCTAQAQSNYYDYVRYSTIPVVIDGVVSEKEWDGARWLPMEENWIGPLQDSSDFDGRYKLQWNEDYLFILVDIADDKLEDTHPDPFDRYWDDDCVEVFIDENNKGGDHEFNHNAFAYHIGINGDVVDLGTDKKPLMLKDHVKVVRNTVGNRSTWEIAISIHGEKFDEKSTANKPLGLFPNKVMGFMIAYCDNDGSKERENFIGNVPLVGRNKNVGYKDANVFGKIVLKRDF